MNLFLANKTTLLIVIAATNNMTQIELENGMIREAAIRLKFLASFLLESSGHIDLGEIFTDTEVHMILSNIMLANGLKASPAA